MLYPRLCTVVALLFFALFINLVWVPDIPFWLFDLQGNEVAEILAKRAGVLFLGLCVLCFAARRSQSPEVQRLIALSVWVAMGGMAVLGIYEFLRGAVGPGMWVAVIIEILIAVFCCRLWFQIRHQSG